MRNWFIRFMTGRYGGDQLNRLVSFVSIAFAVLAIIFSFAMSDSPAGSVLWVIALAFLAVVYYRAFSKNFNRRIDENTRYLKLRYKVSSFIRLRQERWRQRREYKFFTCPSCKTTLRVPRGKGSINIVCRKCGYSFRGKS